MSGKNIIFNEKKIKKSTFYKTKEYIVLTVLLLLIN